MFAKLYSTEEGQILVKKSDENDEGLPEVRFYFDMDQYDLGVCELSCVNKAGSEEQNDELFDEVNLNTVISMRDKMAAEFGFLGDKSERFETVEQWKQGIRDVFKSKLNYSDELANNQADAFEDMYEGEDLKDLPTPLECFQAEMQASQD